MEERVITAYTAESTRVVIRKACSTIPEWSVRQVKSIAEILASRIILPK
jgi:hypothetical protein